MRTLHRLECEENMKNFLRRSPVNRSRERAQRTVFQSNANRCEEYRKYMEHLSIHCTRWIAYDATEKPCHYRRRCIRSTYTLNRCRCCWLGEIDSQIDGFVENAAKDEQSMEYRRCVFSSLAIPLCEAKMKVGGLCRSLNWIQDIHVQVIMSLWWNKKWKFWILWLLWKYEFIGGYYSRWFYGNLIMFFFTMIIHCVIPFLFKYSTWLYIHTNI